MVHRISGQRQALFEILGSGHQIVCALYDFQVMIVIGWIYGNFDAEISVSLDQNRIQRLRQEPTSSIYRYTNSDFRIRVHLIDNNPLLMNNFRLKLDFKS